MNIELITKEINNSSKEELKKLIDSLSEIQRSEIYRHIDAGYAKEDILLVIEKKEDIFIRFTDDDIEICANRYASGEYSDASINRLDNIERIMLAYTKEKSYTSLKKKTTYTIA